jgi:hypothetical protein
MKKNFLVFLLLIIILMQAQQAQTQQQQKSPQDIACMVVEWMCRLLLILTTMTVVFSGYQIATSGGDPQRVADAKRNLLLASIAAIALVNLGNIITAIGATKPCIKIDSENTSWCGLWYQSTQ